jgi:regulator of replication initiation timing
MVNTKELNEKVQALEKSMGTIVRALKELKTGMNELQEQRK